MRLDRQLKVNLESSVTLVAPEGSKGRLLLEKYGISPIPALGIKPHHMKLTNVDFMNSR